MIEDRNLVDRFLDMLLQKQTRILKAWNIDSRYLIYLGVKCHRNFLVDRFWLLQV